MAIYSLHDHDEAFSSIFRTHHGAVVALCRSRLVDASEAEDAAQEAFLRAYRALPDFDPSRQLWPWLATIATNVCTDMLRKRRAVPLSTFDEDPRAHRTIDLTDELDARARARLVGETLHVLPDRQRRAVYLADGEGWSYAEIARYEERTVPAVRTILMRGRSAFRARARSMAEDRGMWPLAAMVPFARLRRLLGRPVKDSTVAAAPAAIGALHVVAAALVIVGVAVPVTTSRTDAGASPRAATPHVVSTSAIGDVQVERAEREPASSAPLLPIVAPASVASDVDVDDTGIVVQASADVDADPDDDETMGGFLTVNCSPRHGSRVCEAIERLPQGSLTQTR